MLLILGATLELTPAEKGMAGAVARAREIVEATPGAVMPQQFDNVANPLIHRVSTAQEIWNDTEGRVDAVTRALGFQHVVAIVAQERGGNGQVVLIVLYHQNGFLRHVPVLGLWSNTAAWMQQACRTCSARFLR